ncbi:MAG: flagellar basal-body MS-ring/collar protein FliF [Alphaproteobacteria bacterium]|nr:flagellar basal-body MS-ring/collar protein FliF [Alphaproteobacteria bacterium]
MNAFLEQLARFGWGRLAAILGLTAGAAAALVIFTLSMNGSGQALLFSGLQPADAASVTERLDQGGIAYELREGGTAVYVDTDQVDAARVRVASGGALGFGSVGYEIFDETDALGTTSFVQNVNARRALEGELARSINTLAGVSRARVHLVLPERRLFSRDQQEPSASVVIQTNGELRAGQVATIQNLVATAVAGLSPSRITIADDSGRLLASPTDGDMATSAALEDRRSQIEERLRRRILDIVEGVVGPGAARVAVTAELSRESRTQTSLVYDPNTQVEVSRREEASSSTEPLNDGAVSVSENQPDAAGTTGGGQPAMATSQNEVTERNYENSSTQTTTVREAGDLERLAVSVVVDQRPVRADDGTISFESRQDELETIERLVAAAVGFPVNAELRAETQILEVEEMAFSRPDFSAGTPAPEGFSLARLDFMRIAEIAVLFITSVLIILLVARPLVRGAIAGPAPAGAAALAGASAGQGRIAARGAGGEQVLLPESEEFREEERIDVAQIDGQVKKSSVRKVASLVDQHPDETMSILRTWMHEDA